MLIAQSLAQYSTARLHLEFGKVDTKTQSQTLGKAWEILRKNGRKEVGSRGVKDTRRIWPTESTKHAS